jgi:hypothetical protein
MGEGQVVAERRNTKTFETSSIVGCFRLCTVQRAANMKGDTGGTEQEGEQF